MNICSVLKSHDYKELDFVVSKHFEVHNIYNEIPKDAKILIKPNLVTDKEAAFSITTNPLFVYAVIKNLIANGFQNITIADCPGGAMLLFSDMAEVFKKCGYSFLSDYAELNTCFDSIDIITPDSFVTKKFNVLSVIAQADYIINVPKLKTHNLTGITCGVKNLFGCIPGLQKPEFHAKFPKTDDFCNMLVELALAVKPNFTIVDAIDIMEGNGPTNGQKRHLGLTFAGKNVFVLDRFVIDILNVPVAYVGTVIASEKKNISTSEYTVIGDKEVCLDKPILLPEYVSAKSFNEKLKARIRTLFAKISDGVLISYPEFKDNCTACRKCVLTCPQAALCNIDGKITLDKNKCIGCLCCDEVCPNGAISIRKRIK